MSFIRLTDHAKERALQRYWIAPQRLTEMAEKAVTLGYSIADAPNDKIKRYLKRKARGKNIYVSGGYVFILKPQGEHLLLITTYRLPERLLRSLPRVKTYIGARK